MNRFFIVDVFAERKYGGNQLAVILLDRPVAASEMQAIAREIGFSETTFASPTPAADGSFAVRIFTPAREIPFAGHPTLGTAYVLRAAGREASDEIWLNLPAGKVPARFDPVDSGVVWMSHPQPEFGPVLPREPVAAMLGLELSQIDPGWPVQQVSTGLPHIIVPLASLTALRRAKVDRAAYFGLIESTWAKNVLVFAREAHEAGNDVSIRMFAEYLGIPEDPATGSGNGCLLAYLVQHSVLGTSDIAVRSEQGYEIGRPSLLHGRARRDEGGFGIQVGGRVMPVAEGIWR